MYTDNPLRDFYAEDAREIQWLSTRPTCSECGEPIQEEECYLINGMLVCTTCLEDNYKRWTEEYCEE